ncbi:MAG: Fic family protein [Candidatus ainarchaeum sp.]|nr:Fic family protein [Candidatus ainarchaeum sp.]MDD3975549.1 Fic family protein [Candidatus ainarchaeum sp.]
MYLTKKVINEKTYFYLEEKINNKTINTFIGVNKIKDPKKFKEILKKHRLNIILKKIKNSKKQKYISTIELIELEKIKYNLKLLKKYFKETYKQYNENEYIRYAQGSATIEGNSINLQEATLIINENLTISGKTINEVKEIQNLKNTRKIIDKLPEITEKLIKKIHKQIMDSFKDKNPGEYRKIPIYVTGSNIKRTNYKNISKEINKLLEWYNKNKKILHPIELTAIFHIWFENIHPFIDGNGRVGRELLNLILLKNDYPRIIINLKNRQEYISILENLQIKGKKEYIQFSKFIYNLLLDKSKEIEEEINNNIELILNKIT